MINQGEQLGQTEATETFFAMTKLFQSKDVSSRQANRFGGLFVRRLDDVATNALRGDQGNVHGGQRRDHRHIKFDSRHDGQRRLASWTRHSSLVQDHRRQ